MKPTLPHSMNLPADLSEFKPLAAMTQSASDETVRNASWELQGRPSPEAPPQRLLVSAQPFTIGRHPDNTLPLANATVSGHHAELVFVGNDLCVRDLGSTNGSFLNGRRVDGMQRLCEGDMLQLGTAMFTVRRQSDAISGATVAADVADHALAHLQFDKLIHEPAVVPFFQPIVRMADGQRLGYEILARSRLIGLETAAVMFRVATERSQAPELSGVLRREGLRLGQMLGLSNQFFVNTDPSELHSPGLRESLTQLRNEFPTLAIVLEIHEAAVTSSQALTELRAHLRDLNIGLAYDDFGAGQSRLMELGDVPPDVIKFDMHLIRGLAQASEERRQLARSLVHMVRDLEVIPLAEGIETADEAEVCRDVGFELAQGYFFGRPAPVKNWVP